MNSLSRILRAVLWGVVTTGLLSLVRQWNGPDAGLPPRGQQADDVSGRIRLHRDPVCGTYVSPEISVKLERAGQVIHFCSADCRERYARPAARAAKA